jgi:hypothetical protein
MKIRCAPRDRPPPAPGSIVAQLASLLRRGLPGVRLNEYLIYTGDIVF